MANKNSEPETVTETENEISPVQPKLEDVVLENLIYITGSARGGTSLMMHLINMHPNVLGFPGPTSFMANVWYHRRIVRERVLRLIWLAPGWLGPTNMISKEQSAIFAGYKKQIGQAFSALNLREIYNLYPMLRYAFLTKNERPQSVIAWSDKANDVGGLDELAKAYSNAKFLFIVRDPRASVNSMFVRELQFRGVDADDDETNRAIIRSTIYWRHTAQGMVRHVNKYPDRSKLIRFEDLINNPTETLTEIFEFALDSQADSELIQHIVDNVSYGASNNPTEIGSGISKAPLGRWSENLPPGTQKLIETLAGPVADLLEYNCSAKRFSGYGKTISSETNPMRKARQISKLLYLDLTSQKHIKK